MQEAFAKDACTDSALALTRNLLSQGGAIVAPIITEIGGKFVIITATRDSPIITVVDLPDLTTNRLKKLLRGDAKDDAVGGWFGAYIVQYLPWPEQRSRIGELRAAIDSIGPTMWTLFAGRLDSELRRLGVRQGGRLIWLPAGALVSCPPGLAWDPAGGRQFIDTYEIAYAPNLEALGFASKSQLAKANDASLAAVVNPTGNIPKLNLPFAEIEGALVVSHFSGTAVTRLDRSNATPEAVLACLKGKTYWHFSSHGLFDWKDARNAGLRMKDEVPLTVGALLEAENLGRPRLVVMSGCQSASFLTPTAARTSLWACQRPSSSSVQ